MSIVKLDLLYLLGVGQGAVLGWAIFRNRVPKNFNSEDSL